MSKRQENVGLKLMQDGRIVRRVSMRQAELMEAAGAWERKYDTHTGALICFQIVAWEMQRVDSDLCTMHSTTAISAAEADLNIQHSSTRGLSEVQRLERLANGMDPEDRPERVQAKVRVYAQIGAQRGDILRVWPR